jgi:hypothetical protein
MAPPTKGKTGRTNMRCMYARNPKEHFRYTLKTDPPDAIYWTTYRLKKSDIVLSDKFDRATTADIKQEIFDDIVSREPNPGKNKNALSKEHKRANRQPIEIRRK